MRRPFSRLASAVLAVAVAGFGLGAAASAATLELTIDNVQGTQGTLMVALYSSAATFRQTPLRVASLPAGSPAVMRFDDLFEGDYAVACYLDRNGNGKLDTNFIGMPNEPYGFSRSGAAAATMGPPSWDQARFAVPAAGTRHTLTLSN